MLSLEIILAILFLIVGFIILIVLINKNRLSNSNPEPIPPVKNIFYIDVNIIDINEEVVLYITSDDITINWGDNSPEEQFSGFSTISHKYNSTGLYTISGTKTSNLTTLACPNTGNTNKVVKLDVSLCENLEEVYFTDNLIPEIYIKSLTNLKIIEIGNNLLTSLDSSNLELLENLTAPGNNLININIQNCKELVRLNLNDNNNLNDLNIEDCEKLQFVNLDNCNFSQNSINNFLYILDINGLSDGQFLGNQNPSAPPSSGPPDGITAKANLISRGWTVNTD